MNHGGLLVSIHEVAGGGGSSVMSYTANSRWKAMDSGGQQAKALLTNEQEKVHD